MQSKVNWKIAFVFVLSTVMLFLGFDRNQWHLSPADSFSNFQEDSESLVLGRMVESRQAGLFSQGALLGWGDAASPDSISTSDYDHQYQVFLSNGKFDSYLIYKSQSGMQATFFSILDLVSPFSSARDLRLFRAFTSMMTALTLSALIVWFFLEFGWVTALMVLATTLISMWFTFYGRNLFYSLWTYFLPFVVTLFWLRRESLGGALKERNLFLLILGLVFFKGLFSGYDFLLPPLGMVATALIYYALKDRWGWMKVTRRIGLAGLVSVLGIFASFLVVAAQVGAVTGHFSDGLIHLANTIGRRTIGETLDPSQSGVFASGGAASLSSVLNVLVNKSAIMAGIKYIHLFYFFLGVTAVFLLILWFRRGSPAEMSTSIALVGATWISICSPLAWVVFFKAHAYFHTHTTSIIWHMPFVIFGYALFGHLFSVLFGRRDLARV
jgi:hypothetical protein